MRCPPRHHVMPHKAENGPRSADVRDGSISAVATYAEHVGKGRQSRRMGIGLQGLRSADTVVKVFCGLYRVTMIHRRVQYCNFDSLHQQI
jgi:hypothetical protein